MFYEHRAASTVPRSTAGLDISILSFELLTGAWKLVEIFKGQKVQCEFRVATFCFFVWLFLYLKSRLLFSSVFLPLNAEKKICPPRLIA